MRIVYNFVRRKPSMTLRPDRYYIVISRINGWNELRVTQKIQFLNCGRCCIVIVWKYIFLCSPYFNFRDTLEYYIYQITNENKSWIEIINIDILVLMSFTILFYQIRFKTQLFWLISTQACDIIRIPWLLASHWTLRC